jgi:hypothetical protein
MAPAGRTPQPARLPSLCHVVDTPGGYTWHADPRTDEGPPDGGPLPLRAAVPSVLPMPERGGDPRPGHRRS